MFSASWLAQRSVLHLTSVLNPDGHCQVPPHLLSSAPSPPPHTRRFIYLERLNPRANGQSNSMDDGDGGGSGGATALSVGNTADTSAWALSEKAMEASACLRFLRTQRNRLKVRRGRDIVLKGFTLVQYYL